MISVGTVSPGVLALAEDLNTHLALGQGDERVARPDAVIWLGAGSTHPALTVVQRLRFEVDSLAAGVTEIRAFLRSRGRNVATWEIGPSARPVDVRDRLLDLGMVPFEEPTAAGMVLTKPLPPITSDVEVVRARTVDEYVEGIEVLHEIFQERTETPEQRRERAERRLKADLAGRGAFFLGRFGGETVAAATGLHTKDAVVLGGSATRPEARGRGAYRALVAARFAEAVRLGTPTLVIQAGVMSRPILERLGFETVARIDILLDGG